MGFLILLTVLCQETVYGLTDRAETEAFHVHITQWQPSQFGSIVGGLDDGIVIDMADEEKVECMNVHAGIAIDIGDTEEITDIRCIDCEPRLFLNLANHALFCILIIVHEPAGQVESPLFRLPSSASHQQLTLSIEDKGSRGGSRILIIGKATAGTMPAQFIVNLEGIATTSRTEPEYF